MWIPNVHRVPGNSAGGMNGDGSRKLTLHSTEGKSIDGAVGAYTAHNSWPHLTVDCPRRAVVEHLDLMVAGRSLRNTAGGADQTNKDGTVHVQIEMVGTAVQPTTLGSPEDLTWFGREVVRPIHELTGIPLVTSVPWRAYPGSFGLHAPQRLSPAAWDAYSGILGHQHVPDNDHGDPGSIDIAWIIRAATEENDDMTEDQLDKALREGKLRGTFKNLIQGSVLDGLREAVDDRTDRGMLRSQVKELINEVLDERDAPPS